MPPEAPLGPAENCLGQDKAGKCSRRKSCQKRQVEGVGPRNHSRGELQGSWLEAVMGDERPLSFPGLVKSQEDSD